MALMDNWGPVDVRRWRDLPCVTSSPATEADVQEGRAVFCVGSVQSVALRMDLPACAAHTDEVTGLLVPIVLIQAEVVGASVLVGFRRVAGGSGVATLREVHLLDGWLTGSA
jgi:hypothetical protein